MNLVTVRWWVIFCSVCALSAYLYILGVFGLLIAADPSGISMAILVLFFILTIFTGVLTYRLSTDISGSENYQQNYRYLEACWYSTELLMALGMMGTLLGFMMMLGPALAAIDLTNIAMAKTGIMNMAAGMSVAVSTTLVGLITSQILKIQLINIEVTLKD